MSVLDFRIFLDAIDNNEAAKFMVGEAPYYVDAKNDNEEPQNIVSAFKLVVYKAWRETHDSRIPPFFVGGLLDALDSVEDQNKAIYCVVEWVWQYRYSIKQKVSGNEYWADLFELDLDEVAFVLRNLLEAHREPLKLDKRWAGADWNSKEGLWEPPVRQAVQLRDELGGPNFVPRQPDDLPVAPPGRVPAGQACPRAGFWYTPVSLRSRRHFQIGDIFPAIASGYGDTLWQWSSDQSSSST